MIMRKLVSTLIAVCAVAVNVNTFAAPTPGDLVNSSRNGKTELVNTTLALADLPTFRANDIIKFDVSGLRSGKHFTLISYKVDEKDLTNNSVQYINQYTLTGDSHTIEYRVRDISEGIYQITLNANSDEPDDVATFYYKVGTPKVELIPAEEGKYYIRFQDNKNGTFSVAFVAKATIGTADVSFSEAGVASFGLDVNLGKDSSGNDVIRTEKFEGSIDEIVTKFLETNKDNIEINGSYTIYYGLTVYNIPNEETAASIKATPVIYDTVANEGGNAH